MSQESPAGWFPDPYGRYEHRYWDALQWTQHVGALRPTGDRRTCRLSPVNGYRADDGLDGAGSGAHPGRSGQQEGATAAPQARLN
ncbi:DUF2510 domain-containing protein [Microbacterium tenebrionis]|uniref:DUF2510 domain-containing protein n=1 Tax=Microbacterium tenebrionis TaxID=2830665 RepID=UPI001C37A483